MTSEAKRSVRVGLLLQAKPEVSGYQGTAQVNGPLEVITPNALPLTKSMYHQIGSASHRLWFPRDETVSFRNIGWMVNTCADADEYELALENFAGAFDQIKIPVLNHPSHVLASRRDRLRQILDGVSGLIVPKSVRFQPDTPEAFRTVFRTGSFEYPVMVQMPASSDLKLCVMIQSDEDWDRIFTLPWGGRNVYMTQSVKHSVKATFAVTPFGARLGNVDAPEGIDGDIALTKRLTQSKRVQHIAAEIRSRIPLDIFGIELWLQGDDQFVLLNLSAAMSFEMPDGGTPSHRLQQKKRFREIERDIWKTLKYVTKIPFKVQLSL